MKNRILLVLLVSMGLGAFAQSKQEKEILQLSNAKFKWLVTKKIDSLQYVLDERLTYIHSNGWVQNKQELIEDLKSGKLTYESIDVIEAKVRTYPKSAVVTGKGKFVASLDGKSNTFNLSYTETYVLQKGNWKLASRHASRLP